jgi:hypothetical protein
MSLKCNACGKRGGKLSPCTACHQAHYCDEVCQKDHWKEHKGQCGKKHPETGEFEFSRPEAQTYKKREEEEEIEEELLSSAENDVQGRFREWLRQFPEYPTPRTATEQREQIEDMMRIAGISELSREERLTFMDNLVFAQLAEQEAKLAMERELILQAKGVGATKRAQIAKYDKHCEKLSKAMVEGLIENGIQSSGQFYGRIRALIEEGMKVMEVDDGGVQPSEEVLMKLSAKIFNDSYDAWHPRTEYVDADVEDEPFSGDEAYDAFWGIALDKFIPFIPATDVRPFYSMTNEKTGHVSFHTRDEYNEIQKARRLEAYKFGNPPDSEILKNFRKTFDFLEVRKVEAETEEEIGTKFIGPNHFVKRAQSPVRGTPGTGARTPPASYVPTVVQTSTQKKSNNVENSVWNFLTWTWGAKRPELIQSAVDRTSSWWGRFWTTQATAAADAQQVETALSLRRRRSPSRGELEAIQHHGDERAASCGSDFVLWTAKVAALIVAGMVSTEVVMYGHNSYIAPPPGDAFIQEEVEQTQLRQQADLNSFFKRIGAIEEGKVQAELQYASVVMLANLNITEALIAQERNPGYRLWREVLPILYGASDVNTGAERAMRAIEGWELPNAFYDLSVELMAKVGEAAYIELSVPEFGYKPERYLSDWKEIGLLQERIDLSGELTTFQGSLQIAGVRLNETVAAGPAAVALVNSGVVGFNNVAKDYELSPDTKKNVQLLLKKRYAQITPEPLGDMTRHDILQAGNNIALVKMLGQTIANIADIRMGAKIARESFVRYQRSLTPMDDPVMTLYQNYKASDVRFVHLSDSTRFLSRNSSGARERLQEEEIAMRAFLLENPRQRYMLASLQRSRGIDPLMVNSYHVARGDLEFAEEFRGRPEAVISRFITNPTVAANARRATNDRLRRMRSIEVSIRNFWRYEVWRDRFPAYLTIGTTAVGSGLGLFNLIFGGRRTDSESSPWADLDRSLRTIRAGTQVAGLAFTTSALAFHYTDITNWIFNQYEFMDAYTATQQQTSAWVQHLAGLPEPLSDVGHISPSVFLFALSDDWTVFGFVWKLLALIQTTGITWWNWPAIVGRVSDLALRLRSRRDEEEVSQARELAPNGRQLSTIFLIAAGASVLTMSVSLPAYELASLAANNYARLGFQLAPFSRVDFSDNFARQLVVVHQVDINARENEMVLQLESFTSRPVPALDAVIRRHLESLPDWRWLEETQMPSPLHTRMYTEEQLEDLRVRLQRYEALQNTFKHALVRVRT